MRRWLFVLLILILPLRGWVGDAMATQMALPGPHAAAGVSIPHGDGHAQSAQEAHVMPVVMAAADDCGGHTAVQDGSGDLEAAHCEVCAMCQTCHTVAVLSPPHLLVQDHARPASPLTAMPAFASADRALLLKPPIS